MLKRLGAIAFIGIVAWWILSWGWPSSPPIETVDVGGGARGLDAPAIIAEPTPRVEAEAPAAAGSPDAPAWPPPILPLLSRPGEPTGRLTGYVFDVRGAPVPGFWINFQHPRRHGAGAHSDKNGLYQLELAADTWAVTGQITSRNGVASGGTSFGEVEVIAERTTTFNLHLAGDAKLVGNAYLDSDEERNNVVNVRLLEAGSRGIVGWCKTSGADPLEHDAPEDRPALAERPIAKRPGYFAFHGLAHGHYILSIRPAWQLSPEIEPYFTYQERPIELDGDLELPTMTFSPNDFGLRFRKDESSK